MRLSATQAVPVRGSWGTKIEALVRYLLYLHATAPEDKSLVFSQWDDVLGYGHRARPLPKREGFV